MSKTKTKSLRNDTIDREKATIKSLRQKLKKANAEIRRLKSQLRTYDKAFEKTKEYLKDHTSDISVEELIEAAKQDKTLGTLKKELYTCEVCGSKDVTTIPGNGFRVMLCQNCKHRKKIINGGTGDKNG